MSRLARVEGQIRGLQEMVQREERCEKIAQQITAVREAFNKVFSEMIAEELQAIEDGKSITVQVRHARLAALVSILSKYA